MKKYQIIFTFTLLVHLAFSTQADFSQQIDKVIIWGHKLHTHTHSYIHQAFYRTFKYLGYETYWLDHTDDLSNLNLSNSLFITEWQSDKKMPLIDNCFYAIHNLKIKCLDFCSPRLSQYQKLIDSGRCINFRPTHNFIPKEAIKKEPFVFYDFTQETLFMPWATDLLPHEIEQSKKEILNVKKTSTINLIGTHYKDLDSFISIAKKSGINFTFHRKVSIEKNKKLIQQSYIAPAIVTEGQQTFDYIPCRIFKNISYGQLGITNSRATQELFRGNLIFHENYDSLFKLAQKALKSSSLSQQIVTLMDIVKNEHTYINRIEVLLDFVEKNYYKKRNNQ